MLIYFVDIKFVIVLVCNLHGGLSYCVSCDGEIEKSNLPQNLVCIFYFYFLSYYTP
jgi:hypothetical protein